MKPLLLLLPLLCYTSLVSAMISPTFLVQNKGHEIKLIDKSGSRVLVSRLEYNIAMDVDTDWNLVFYVNDQDKLVIFHIDTPENQFVTSIEISELTDSLYVDWISKIVYWADRDSQRIEMASYAQYKFKNVKQANLPRVPIIYHGLYHISHLCVDPEKRYLFFVHYFDYTTIERTNLDGSNRTVIFDLQNQEALSMTLDRRRSKIYFAVNGNISSIDYEHNSLIRPNRATYVVQNAGMVETLSADEEYLYWANQSGLFYVSLRERPSKVDRLNFPVDAEPLIIRIMDVAKKVSSNLDRRKYPCSFDNGHCSHICVHVRDVPFARKCLCPTGVRLVNQTSCAEKIFKILLLAQRSEMRMISLDTKDYTDQKLSIMPKNAIAIDFDYLNNEIYYSDGDLGTISRAKLNQKKEDVEMFVEDAGFSDGIVIDWISRNLYWTDHAKYRIEVINIDKKFRRSIVSSGLIKPRAIVVDPKRGYLFWTDWSDDDPKIERSFLDGSNREIFATLVSGSYPNGLSLDIENNYLYYVDAKNDQIVRFNASNIGDPVVIQKQGEFHIFGFTMLDSYIYLSDWAKRRLIRIDRHSKNGDLTVLRDNLADLMGIKAIDLAHPPDFSLNDCSRNNGNCSHFCFFTPRGVVCSCPSHLDLSDDGKSCVVSRCCIIYLKNETLPNSARSVVPVQNLMKQCLDYKIFNPRTIPYTVSNGALVSGDYLWTAQTMYWIYVENSGFVSIKEIDFNGTDKNNIDNGISPVEGIAIDWISSNLYFSDSFYNSIQVMHIVHRRRRVLVWKNIIPRQLVVHPKENSLFWVDHGSKKRLLLKKSDLAGHSIEDLYCYDYYVNHRSIVSLVIDRESDILYFADSRNIFSVNWRSRQCRALSMDNHGAPLSLSLYDGKLLWANKRDTKLRFCRSKDACLMEDLVYNHSTDMISMMTVYNDGQKSAKGVSNPCTGLRSHACYDMCLPSVAIGSLCACATHYSTMNSDDCAPPRSFLLFSQRESIYRTVMEDTNAQFEDYSTYEGPPPILLLRNKSLAMPLILLAYDPNSERIIWISADDYDENVYWLHMSSDTPEAMSRNNVVAVKFFVKSEILRASYDPFTSCVFWIEYGSHYSIIVSKLDHIHQPENHFRLVSNPGANIVDLAIDARNRFLYYVDKSKDLLQTAKQSKDDRKLPRHTIYACPLFHSPKRLSQFGLPCGIFRDKVVGPMSLFTVDSLSGSVLWVESPTVNNKQKTVINRVDSSGHFSRFDMGYDMDLLALTIYDRKIFFIRLDQDSFLTHSPSNNADTVDKARLGRLEFMPLDFVQDYEKDIVLMHYVLIDQLPKFWSMNEDIFVGVKESSCPSPQCSHFCWPLPVSKKATLTHDYECGCPVDMNLSPNNRTCANRASCQSNQFLCNDGLKCVDYGKLCDLQDDCADKSDESDFLCDCSIDPAEWQSDAIYSSNLLSANVVNKSSLLDYGSKNSWKSSRPRNKYRCGNHRHVCIDKSKFCDKIADCPDSYDEIGCDCPRGIMCQRDEIGVLTTCLRENLLCDHRNDCYDNLDEVCPGDRIPHVIAPTTWGLIIIAMFVGVTLMVAYFTCRNGKNDSGPTIYINQRTNNTNNTHFNFADNGSNEPGTLSTGIEMRTPSSNVPAPGFCAAFYRLPWISSPAHRTDANQNNDDTDSRLRTRTNSDSIGDRSAARLSVSSGSTSGVSSGIHRRPDFHYYSSNDENAQNSPPKLPSLASDCTRAPSKVVYGTASNSVSIHLPRQSIPLHKHPKKIGVRRHHAEDVASPPPSYYETDDLPLAHHSSETTTLLQENACSSNSLSIVVQLPSKLPPPAPPNSCFDVEEDDDQVQRNAEFGNGSCRCKDCERRKK